MQPQNNNKQSSDIINGMTLVATRDPIDATAITPLKEKYNADHAAVVPYAMMRDLNSPEVIYNKDKGWWGEKPEGVAKTIQLMHDQNIAVMLKPQVWIWRGEYTGFINLTTEEEWKILENTYENYIMTFAQIAQENKVELFCVGTELESFIAARPNYWDALITKIKAVYKGKLTYASNWDSYAKVHFWEQLDFIGVDAYFPMCNLITPSVANAKASWEKWKVDLSTLSRKRNKPILFTEYGYISADYAGLEPWKDAQEDHKINEEAQVILLQTMYDEVWKEDWFAGGFLWKHHAEFGRRGLEKQFSTQDKLAEKTVKQQYSKL